MRATRDWRRLLNPLRFIISGGLLTYFIWSADPRAIWAEWRSVDLLLIGLALLLQLLGVMVSAAKWGVLLRARGQAQPYPFLLGTYFVGQFANNFLPTSVGGDALRVVQLGRRIGSYSQASASVFLDRLTGFLALSLIAGAALVLSAVGFNGAQVTTSPALTLLTAGFALAAVGAGLASFSAPRILKLFGGQRLPEALRRPLQKVADALADYTPQGRRLLYVLALSFLFHSIWIGLHVICGLALGITAPLLIYALMVPITDIVGLAPIFVNNVGAREAVFTLYLAQAGISPATAVALAFLAFTVRLVISAIGGLIVLFGGADLRVTAAVGNRPSAAANSASSPPAHER